jgi:hypothetical protein
MCRRPFPQRSGHGRRVDHLMVPPGGPLMLFEIRVMRELELEWEGVAPGLPTAT